MISKNELDTFNLHDCTINFAEFKKNNLVLKLNHINVLEANSNNKIGLPKETDKALFTIYDCKIQKVVDQLPITDAAEEKTREIELFLKNNEIISILENSEIADCDFSKENIMTLAVFKKCNLIILEGSFNKCEMIWGKFVKDAWFVRR